MFLANFFPFCFQNLSASCLIPVVIKNLDDKEVRQGDLTDHGRSREASTRRGQSGSVVHLKRLAAL